MDIQLKRNSATPLYQQLKNIIRDQILSGQLADGFKLPSERQLVEKLKVHRNTVKKAYELLIAEGLVYASARSPRGYFVRNVLSEAKPDQIPEEKRAFSSLDKNFNYHFLGMQNTFQRLYNSSYLSDGIPFAGVLSNRETLPFADLKEILAEIAGEECLEPFWFCDPQGTERLRGCLTDMLFKRNIYVQPQNIQIINETYEALSNIALMYLKEGDYAIVEEPALPAIVNILLHTGAHVLFVPVGLDGMQIDVFENLVERYRPKLIYTMPSFHNPTGCVMSLEKRKRLLRCAVAYSIPIVEDDSMNDFNYSDAAMPSLYSMDRTSSVIYIDSANLSFFPGARVGYIVAPDNVIKTYRRIINKERLFINSLSQYMWARFFEKGGYEKQKSFLRGFYTCKRDLMCGLLAQIPGLSFSVPKGGLVIWVRLPEHLNDRQVTAAAERRGVLVMPGNTFFAEGNKGESYLRLSYSCATDEQIVEGVRRLQEVIESCNTHH